MGFMVLKTTSLNLWFQRKNCFWKMCTKSYCRKGKKFLTFAWKAIFGYIFANILGLCAYISNSIFALKPWVQAGRFEYHKPYKLNEFFLSCKGSFRILKRKSTQLKFENSILSFVLFVLFLYYHDYHNYQITIKIHISTIQNVLFHFSAHPTTKVCSQKWRLLNIVFVRHSLWRKRYMSLTLVLCKIFLDDKGLLA